MASDDWYVEDQPLKSNTQTKYLDYGKISDLDKESRKEISRGFARVERDFNALQEQIGELTERLEQLEGKGGAVDRENKKRGKKHRER